MTDQDIFLNYINDNYIRLKRKYHKYCLENSFIWDEDVYSETILKCYDAIVKNGRLKDSTPQGIENYFFKAIRNNIMNEGRYCRTKCRDKNINSDNIEPVYEAYYNSSNISAKQKLINDLFIDFSTLYIMMEVEKHFDQEHFYLYRVKTLSKGMTFKKLQEMTNIKSSRKKVIEVQRYVKENIKKEDIKKAFHKLYEDLIEF